MKCGFTKQSLIISVIISMVTEKTLKYGFLKCRKLTI